MSREAMSLKAKIRNFAKQKDISAQVVLQNFMFERFLERLSESPFRDKFIIKGGFLIASIVGIDQRSTMDLDMTLKQVPLARASLIELMEKICSIPLNDNVQFTLKKVEQIREDDVYGGFRASLVSDYDSIVTPIQIDITTGDAITPKEVQYHYKTLFSDREIPVKAYNVETIMAEKIETILRRGEFSTRPRDFYDMYVLAKTQSIQMSLLKKAIQRTAENRGTTWIFNDVADRITSIENSATLQKHWEKYTVSYPYAKNITYAEVMESLKSFEFLKEY